MLKTAKGIPKCPGILIPLSHITFTTSIDSDHGTTGGL